MVHKAALLLKILNPSIINSHRHIPSTGGPAPVVNNAKATINFLPTYTKTLKASTDVAQIQGLFSAGMPNRTVQPIPSEW